MQAAKTAAKAKDAPTGRGSVLAGNGGNMKKSELYRSVLVDVICVSGGEITDECFEKIILLAENYVDACRSEGSADKHDEMYI